MQNRRRQASTAPYTGRSTGRRESLDEDSREKVSRLLSYFLRHELEIERTSDGYVKLDVLLKKMKQRIPWVTLDNIIEVVKTDQNGRYEAKNDMLRARYGHSVPVDLGLPDADVGLLYLGTSQKFIKKILEAGLKPVGRHLVHLSVTTEDAIEVGKQHSPDPVLLVIDVAVATKSGAKVMKASDKVYVADRVPPESIKLLE